MSKKRWIMNQFDLSTDGASHSFELCIWHTTPKQWHGTVRHLESDAQLAFLNVEQAVHWMTHYLASEQNNGPEAASKVE
jgi:hypothetical protein